MVQAGLRAQLAMQSFVTGQLRVDLDFRPDTPAQLVGAIGRARDSRRSLRSSSTAQPAGRIAVP